jgi:amidohydrolase
MIDFVSEAQALSEYTRFLRRDFHRHPELGFQEVRTAGIVARELSQLGLEVTTGIAKTGVVALLEGTRPGPVVLARFDMDALPIKEETGAEYASVNPGVMHACGHDGHTAIGITVARLLHDHIQDLSGAIKFVFQPAEEGLGGAEGMIAEGVLQQPSPDYVLALHLWNEKPVGWFGIAPGPVMAASEVFQVRITGKGGHGALPHLAVDPLLAAAHIVTALQSIAARNINPLQSAVVSVTSIHAGETFNVIPPSVEMSGTIRTFEKEARQIVLDRFRQIVAGVAESLGCTAEIEVTTLTPAVVNDPRLAEMVSNQASRSYPGCQVDSRFRTMVSEDMAYMMQTAPGCFFFVGSANPARGLDAPHHHPRFDVDEEALTLGAGLMSALITSLLN